MPDPTLLIVMSERFGTFIDPDSDAGQILGSLIPRPPFDANAWTGQADNPPLTFALTSQGVSVRAAQAGDALVFSLPSGSLDFKLIPIDATHPAPSVELTLLNPTLPVPFLTAAQVSANDLLQPAAGSVSLHLPALLLVITASQPADVHLAPATVGGGLDVTMQPPFALLNPGSVVGFGFTHATLTLDGPDLPAITAPDVDIFIAPPGLPALATRAAAHALRIGLTAGDGLSGDFTLNLAGGAAPARPAWLRLLQVRLGLAHSTVTLLSLSGQIALRDAVEAKLGGALDGPHTADTLDYTLSLSLDGEWRAALALSAPGGGYLWRTQRASPAGSDPLRDTLGAYLVFAPLLAPDLPAAGASGYSELALGAGAAATLTASGLAKTQAVTLYGGELIVKQEADGTAHAFLFFDVETELTVSTFPENAPLLRTRTPIKVRHQAIGIQLDFSNGQIKPVFDRARGFGLDLSDPGLFELPAPLGNIVQPQGARMARDNPLNFEVDLVLKADLGVVTVDRATVRIPIDTAAPPTLTALGASLDIPGALSGRGYLQITPTGFAGSLDASLTALGVRVAAGLAVEQLPDVTAILATLGVELPVPIPLANSGLGLFGFIGLFGMHYKRIDAKTALEWFTGPADGDATRRTAWEAAVNHWALGVGTVLGTLEGGFLIHAKGMIVIEAPGPSLLLVMNADLLSLRPSTLGKETGAFLAVIEISPNALTIGILLEYGIQPLFELRVPVEAFYNPQTTDDWHLDVGGFPPRQFAAVRYLFSFNAEGYFMLHGNGIPSPGEVVDPAVFPIGPLSGFSVAAGVRAALTWGLEDIGLYLRVAAQADVGISFKPFLIIGKMKLSGELHLFIVGLEVSAAAEVIITPETFFVSAEVCGKVEFFFFDVEGCVTLELGDRPQHLPAAEPLLRAVSLHSRAPALVSGTGADAPIDGSLGDARLVGEAGDLPVVPIDAIPVLQFEMAPVVDPACKVLGQALTPKLSPDGWARRGSRYYRYTLQTVELIAHGADGGILASPVTDGETPSTWWDRHLLPSGGEDNDVQLALLNWLPDPTPAAAERTQALDERVRRRWETLCVPIAPPANVLWNFRTASLGSAPSGWTLTGTAWPDPPGTSRSAPATARLHVTEPWRSHSLADGLSAVRPAVVIGSRRNAARVLLAPRTGLERRPAAEDDRMQVLLDALQPPGWDTLADSLRLDTHGLTFIRLMLAMPDVVRENGWLQLRALDADGNDLGFQFTIDPNQTIQASTPQDLPDPWRDTGGPWAKPIEDAWWEWWTICSYLTHEAPFIVLETPLPAGTASVLIGSDTEVDLDPMQPYWELILAEAETLAEHLRYESDELSRTSNLKTVDGALHADQGQRALLRPNTEYNIKITYSVLIGDLDEQQQVVAQADDDGHPIVVPGTQEFRFRTDAAAPHRLAPWVLVTDPAPYEDFFFWEDPLRVVFATNATRQLYAAYGRELFAVVKAASGHHPAPTPGKFDAARVALAGTVVQPQGIPAEVVTPWESALGTVLPDLDCLPEIQETDRHEINTLTLQLEPRTAYVLDLETDRSADGSLYRLHFNTSRYATMQVMAQDLAAAPVRHRRLASAAPLTALGTLPPGERCLTVRDLDLENALRAAQWGDLARPTQPRATVIWDDSVPPQPVAVLLETPEPLWRWRPVPQEVPDDAGTRRFELVPQCWLDVEETAGGDVVAQFVVTTGGSRALILLWPPARGNALYLDLRRHHHRLFERDTTVQTVPLLNVPLGMAPWEATS